MGHAGECSAFGGNGQLRHAGGSAKGECESDCDNAGAVALPGITTSLYSLRAPPGGRGRPFRPRPYAQRNALASGERKLSTAPRKLVISPARPSLPAPLPLCGSALIGSRVEAGIQGLVPHQALRAFVSPLPSSVFRLSCACARRKRERCWLSFIRRGNCERC